MLKKIGGGMMTNSLLYEVMCPGCTTLITIDTAGGYRSYCQKCVDAIPPIPEDRDERGFAKGYHLEGRYPNFRWESKS